mmetsp:Transcript_18010/g.37498  ORF Transcript_18010/g.37498 Transcript_18010/m.37498 type:complete len:498 (+) Transcript_18010:197-1690(+)
MDETTPNFSSYLDSDAVYPVPGEEEGWEQPLKLSGDFYCDDDDITRGVSMPAAPPDMSWTSFDMYGDVEFYGKSEDVFKGMHMDISPPDLYLQDPLDMPHILKTLPEGLDHIGLADVAADSAATDPGSVRRFTETDRPPLAPSRSQPLFHFSATTLRIISTAPFEIGNLLLDFLGTQVKSLIMKVNSAKFAIKAEVFIDGASCLLKARCYEQACDAFCVEFQRRKGDCMAFGKTYQLAAEYLTMRFPSFPVTTDIPELPKVWPPRQGFDIVDAEDTAPLIDMAEDTSLPDLQAESAAALLELAQNSSQAQCLCNPRAFNGIKELLRSSQDNIKFPTACMLSALAQRPEAAPCFADQGILSLLADTIRSTATSELVQQELAQALHTTLASRATVLSEKVSEEVMGALADATKDVHIGNASVRSSLLEAYAMLERRCTGVPGQPSGEATVVQCGGTGLAAGGPKAERQPPALAQCAPVQPCTSSPLSTRSPVDLKCAAS